MLPDEKPEVTATGSESTPLPRPGSAQVPGSRLTEHLLVVRA